MATTEDGGLVYYVFGGFIQKAHIENVLLYITENRSRVYFKAKLQNSTSFISTRSFCSLKTSRLLYKEKKKSDKTVNLTGVNFLNKITPVKSFPMTVF